MPKQVELTGPLNKISCFSFEGGFKICSSEFHGTVNIPAQIANRVQMKNYTVDWLQLRENRDSINNMGLLEFIDTINQKKHTNRAINMLPNSTFLTVDQLSTRERTLIFNLFLNNETLGLVEMSDKAFFKKMSNY